jgi:hypothetical protein
MFEEQCGAPASEHATTPSLPEAIANPEAIATA